MKTSKTILLASVMLASVSTAQKTSGYSDCVIDIKNDLSQPSRRDLKSIRALEKTDLILVRKNEDGEIDSLRGRIMVMSDNSVGFVRSRPDTQGWKVEIFTRPNSPNDYIFLRAACMDSKTVK